MSVTSIGASGYTTTHFPWSGQSGRWPANKPSDQNSGNTANPAASDTTANDNTAPGSTINGPTNVANAGSSYAATPSAGNAATNGPAGAANNVSGTVANNAIDTGINPLPPVQAATTLGTGQKIDVIV